MAHELTGFAHKLNTAMAHDMAVTVTTKRGYTLVDKPVKKLADRGWKEAEFRANDRSPLTYYFADGSALRLEDMASVKLGT